MTRPNVASSPSMPQPTQMPMIARADGVSLTTSFTPPSQCTNSLTMLADQSYKIWYNEPVPVPAETFSECYAPEFITSYLESLGGATLPAFSPLLCQRDYSTVYSSFSGTTKGFSFHPPDSPVETRPAFGGTCFIDITSTVVQYYDSSSFVSTTTVTNTAGVLQAYAHPMDGFAMSTLQDPSSAALAGASSVIQDVEGSGATEAASQSAAITTPAMETSRSVTQSIGNSVTSKGSVPDTAVAAASESQYTHHGDTYPAQTAAAATPATTSATPDPTHVANSSLSTSEKVGLAVGIGGGLFLVILISAWCCWKGAARRLVNAKEADSSSGRTSVVNRLRDDRTNAFVAASTNARFGDQPGGSSGF
ncbi:MAG: hypothetical protein Q9220_002302 [cf. Caloplaca sp. 1 TL-2023]